MRDYRKGIHALEWHNKMLDFQVDDLVLRIRDIQLLRVTKQMQEYIRSGDEHKHASEAERLEKRAEYSAEAHEHKVVERKRVAKGLRRKIAEKVEDNSALGRQLEVLGLA